MMLNDLCVGVFHSWGANQTLEELRNKKRKRCVTCFLQAACWLKTSPKLKPQFAHCGPKIFCGSAEIADPVF